MSISNCCFLTCIQVSQEAAQVIWDSHLFQNFPQFVVIHTVKGFGIVNKAETNVFLELSWTVSGLKFFLFLFFLSLSPSYSPTTASFWPERRKAKPKDSKGWGAGMGNRLWNKSLSFVGKSSSFLPYFWNISLLFVFFIFVATILISLCYLWSVHHLSLFKDYLLGTNCILNTSYFSLKQHNYVDYVYASILQTRELRLKYFSDWSKVRHQLYIDKLTLKPSLTSMFMLLWLDFCNIF